MRSQLAIDVPLAFAFVANETTSGNKHMRTITDWMTFSCFHSIFRAQSEPLNGFYLIEFNRFSASQTNVCLIVWIVRQSPVSTTLPVRTMTKEKQKNKIETKKKWKTYQQSVNELLIADVFFFFTENEERKIHFMWNFLIVSLKPQVNCQHIAIIIGRCETK